MVTAPRPTKPTGICPTPIDTDRDGGLLDRFGLDIGDLLEKFGGGGLGKLLG